MTNIFIEGIQGAGKSTLLNKLQKEMTGYKAYREGDSSPVELAWCSYLTMEQYQDVENRYPDLCMELKAHTITEGNRKITAYTRILTDIPGFHKFMEGYEIYNGNIGFPEFQEIILSRYASFHGSGNIFECSFFQNSIECMMLFYQMSDKEIIAFFERVYNILKSKEFRMIYLSVPDVEQAIMHIKKERVDEKGQEMWFPLMLQFLKESPYGRANNKNSFDDLICHLEHRIALEGEIIEKIIGKKALIVEGKNYDIEEIYSFIR